MCVSVPKKWGEKENCKKTEAAYEMRRDLGLARATEHRTWPEVWPKCGAAQAAATAAPITSRAGLLPEAIRHLMHLRAKFCTEKNKTKYKFKFQIFVNCFDCRS